VELSEPRRGAEQSTAKVREKSGVRRKPFAPDAEALIRNDPEVLAMWHKAMTGKRGRPSNNAMFPFISVHTAAIVGQARFRDCAISGLGDCCYDLAAMHADSLARARLDELFRQLAEPPPAPPERQARHLVPARLEDFMLPTAEDVAFWLRPYPGPVAGDLAALIADEQVVLDAMESADFAT
jgi:hypothetical protein